MSGPKECIHMSIEEFKKETEETCNLGFKHGADMVLKMVKMFLREDDYMAMEKAVHGSEQYKIGKRVDDAANAWAAKKQKEFGHER